VIGDQVSQARATASRALSPRISKDFEGYQAITSLACQQVHLVNAASGKVLGCEDDE
jgi:hypothetical protein